MRPARTVRELEGQVGLPMPLAELAGRDWDAVIVGGGHNGLAAAAYLARAGRSALVLERRERLGGACTIERPFADERYLVSPCAYVVGLLDELVVTELGLRRRGYRVSPCDPHLWCGFADGSSYADFADAEATATHLRGSGFTESDVAGLDAYHALIGRARAALRSGPAGDSWVGPSPSRAELERRLGGDPELIGLVFEDSIAEVVERYVDDPRLHQALWGQGVIGTDAGPRTPGTAAINLMHSQGTLEGAGGAWGFVRGGMGTVSFAIADAALEAGATLATEVPVARILPGEGVEIDSGELIRARTVISNADPKRMRALLPATDIPAAFAERLDAWRTSSPVAKLNAGLLRMPTFASARGDLRPERAMVTVALPIDEGQAAWEASRRGEIRIGFCELYFQTAYDSSVSPPGRQTMSVFAQYVPAGSSGAEAGPEQGAPMADAILDAVATSAPDIRECIEFAEVLGPAEIEQRIGLTGGHIFQGSALPEQMWEQRFDHRTPIESLYMCGAATHPGGSVIGLNGRNAAMAALDDLAG